MMRMRKSNRNLLILAVTVFALGAAVYAELEHERTLGPQPLSAIDLAAVQRLEIRCAGVCRSRVFQRDGAQWRMTEPLQQPASGEAVAHLLAVAHAPARVRLNRAAYDLAKLGLDPPLVSLHLDATVIDVGEEDPLEHDRYVRVGDALLRVPDRFSARLFEAPESELATPRAAGN